MEDAYVIGIRLALDNAVSAGVAVIRQDLLSLDRAIAGTTARLGQLAAISALTTGIARTPPAPSRSDIPAQVTEPPSVGNDPIAASKGQTLSPILGQRLYNAVVSPQPLPTATQQPKIVVQSASIVGKQPTSVVAPPALPALATTRLPEPRLPAVPIATAPAGLISPVFTKVELPPAAPQHGSSRSATLPVAFIRRVEATSLQSGGVATSKAPTLAPPSSKRQESTVGELPTVEPSVARPAAPPIRAILALPNNSLNVSDATGFSRQDRADLPGATTRSLRGSPMPSAPLPKAPASTPAVHAVAPHALRSQSATTGGDVFLDGTRLGHWLSAHLARESSRPPSGSTGFDPRLGISWPGTQQGG